MSVDIGYKLAQILERLANIEYFMGSSPLALPTESPSQFHMNVHAAESNHEFVFTK